MNGRRSSEPAVVPSNPLRQLVSRARPGRSVPRRVAQQRERDAGGREPLSLRDDRALRHHLVPLRRRRASSARRAAAPTTSATSSSGGIAPAHSTIWSARRSLAASHRHTVAVPCENPSTTMRGAGAREVMPHLHRELLEVRDVVLDLGLAVLARHPRRAHARRRVLPALAHRIEVEARQRLRRDDQSRAVVESRERRMNRRAS